MTARSRLAARAYIADVGLALLLVVIGVVGTARADAWGTLGVRPVNGWAFALVVGAAAALAGRRLWPLVTLAVAAVLASAYLIVGYPYGPILVSFFVAVYTAARYRPLAKSLPVSSAALVLLLVHVFGRTHLVPEIEMSIKPESRSLWVGAVRLHPARCPPRSGYPPATRCGRCW